MRARRLLNKYRVPIGVVARALAERRSPYAPVVAAVNSTAAGPGLGGRRVATDDGRSAC